MCSRRYSGTVFASGQTNAPSLCDLERLTSEDTGSTQAGCSPSPPIQKQSLCSGPNIARSRQDISRGNQLASEIRAAVRRSGRTSDATLTEQGHDFDWTDDCQIVFGRLKQRLTSAPVLTHPSPERQFILTADASAVGIEAELAQRTNEGLRPVAYFIRTLKIGEELFRVRPGTSRDQPALLWKPPSPRYPYRLWPHQTGLRGHRTAY